MGVTAVMVEAVAGYGADSEFAFVPAEVEPLPIEAVPGDSTMPSDCPALDMAANTLPHKKHFGLDWRAGLTGQDAAVYKQP